MGSLLVLPFTLQRERDSFFRIITYWAASVRCVAVDIATDARSVVCVFVSITALVSGHTDVLCKNG